eukprot:COSAG02_NODE_3974_length_5968_cov_26.913466_8_plen_85_part_00
MISSPLAPGELYIVGSGVQSVPQEQLALRKLTSMNDEWLSGLVLGNVEKVEFPCKDTRKYTHVGHRAIRSVPNPYASTSSLKQV